MCTLTDGGRGTVRFFKRIIDLSVVRLPGRSGSIRFGTPAARAALSRSLLTLTLVRRAAGLSPHNKRCAFYQSINREICIYIVTREYVYSNTIFLKKCNLKILTF